MMLRLTLAVALIALAGAAWAQQADFRTLARSAGTPQVPGLNVVYLSPLGDPYLYYTSTSTPKSFTVLAHLTNVGNSSVRLSFANGGGPPGNGAFKNASLVSGTTANGTWSASFTSSTTEVISNASR